jgi:hypothetical protein
VVSEDGPHSWVVAMAEHQIKKLRFPEEFGKLSSAEQLAAVQQRVLNHYQETDGRLPYFGAILRYRFSDSFDSSMILDISGNVIGNAGKFTAPNAWISLR